MFISKFYAKNFIGIKLGLGLDEITLDFSQKFSRYYTIRGENGSGKSTLFEIMHPLIESYSTDRNLIIPGKEGYKELEIINNGNVYVCKILYPEKSSNKAWIEENGVELNPNGNISSYKAILEEKFNLKPEILKSLKLGSQDSSFISETTTKRKEYFVKLMEEMSDIINKYNIVNKKVNALESKKDLISDKMVKLPDPNETANKQKTLDIKLKELEKSLSNINKTIGKTEEKINTLIENNKELLEEFGDKEELLEKIEVLKKQQNFIENNIENIYNNFSILRNKSLEEIEELLNSREKKLQEENLNLNNLKEKLKEFEEKRNKIFLEIKENENLLKEFSETSIDKLREQNKKLSIELKELKEELNNPILFKLVKENNIILENHPLLLQYLRDVENYFDVVKEIINQIKNNVVNISIQSQNIKIENDADQIKNFLNNYDSILKKLNNSIANLEAEEETLSQELKTNIASLKLIDILKQRPSNCTIDSCAFIAGSLKAKENEKLIPIQTEKLEKIKEKLNKLILEKKTLENLNPLLERYKNVFNKFNKFKNNQYFNYIFSEKEYDNFLDNPFINEYEKIIASIGEKKEFFINYDNYIKKEELYNNNQNIIIEFENNGKKQKENITKKLTKLSVEAEENENNIKKLKEDIQNSEQKVKKFNESILILNDLIKNIKQYEENNSYIEKYSSSIEKYKEFKEKKEELENDLKQINEQKITLLNEKEYIQEEKTKCMNYISQYIELEQEKKELDEQYEKHLLVKKALDVKTGIPLIFTSRFVKKLENKANELLDVAFEGKFQLKFIVDENKFKIPVIIDGMILDEEKDDIRMKSSGEIALTKLSIALAMLDIQNYSSSYNILYLDELDGPLSAQNRAKFKQILDSQCDSLNIDQVFIITHNPEFELAESNLILLRGHNTPQEQLNNSSVSVLFNYDELKIK